MYFFTGLDKASSWKAASDEATLWLHPVDRVQEYSRKWTLAAKIKLAHSLVIWFRIAISPGQPPDARSPLGIAKLLRELATCGIGTEI
jgi:hypothetical protein